MCGEGSTKKARMSAIVNCIAVLWSANISERCESTDLSMDCLKPWTTRQCAAMVSFGVERAPAKILYRKWRFKQA